MMVPEPLLEKCQDVKSERTTVTAPLHLVANSSKALQRAVGTGGYLVISLPVLGYKWNKPLWAIVSETASIKVFEVRIFSWTLELAAAFPLWSLSLAVAPLLQHWEMKRCGPVWKSQGVFFIHSKIKARYELIYLSASRLYVVDLS